MGTLCGLPLADKFLFVKEYEAETGQAANGLFPPAARLAVASHTDCNPKRP